MPHRPGERAAALLGGGGGHAWSGERSAAGGTGLDPPVAVRGGRSGAGVLPRAAAVASAREAVRRSRERREAMRVPGAPPPVHGAPPDTGAVPAAEMVRDAGAARATGAAPGGEHAGGAGAREHGASAGTGVPLAAGERARLAWRERLPLWVQLRCGIDPRTLLALTVVLVVAVGFAVHHFWTGRPEAVQAPSAERTGAGPADVPGADGRAPGSGRDSGQLSGKRLVVDVGGKVRDPGVHRLPSGSRVADALEAAGGVRPGTDLHGLNRARRLVDGEQIIAGAPAGPSTGSGAGSGAGGGGADGGRGGAASGGPAQGGLVSLSSATVEQLETLPGVGPVLAQHIVEYREEHGGFTSVEQLQEVNGIGDRRFADIRPKVSP